MPKHNIIIKNNSHKALHTMNINRAFILIAVLVTAGLATSCTPRYGHTRASGRRKCNCPGNTFVADSQKAADARNADNFVSKP